MLKSSRRQRRRPLLAEINIVPYIDVMLVLLVIFMVTAPLIRMGVKVNLPRETAGALTSPSTESVVISVDANGSYFIDIGKEKHLSIDAQALHDRLKLVLDYKRDTPILVRADHRVDYGRVVRAMVIAQTAGAADVGLITVPPNRNAP
ncbi:protein TolR [Chromatium weissei]|nr:protein TolR [Chromatium weissei]